MIPVPAYVRKIEKAASMSRSMLALLTWDVDLDQTCKASAREALKGDMSSRPIGRTFLGVRNKSALGIHSVHSFAKGRFDER